MSEKTIRVCDDCGINLETFSWAKICNLDICAKCERRVAEAHYSKSTKKANPNDELTKCLTCSVCKGSGKVPTGIPYTSAEKCEKCGRFWSCYGWNGILPPVNNTFAVTGFLKFSDSLEKLTND